MCLQNISSGRISFFLTFVLGLTLKCVIIYFCFKNLFNCHIYSKLHTVHLQGLHRRPKAKSDHLTLEKCSQFTEKFMYHDCLFNSKQKPWISNYTHYNVWDEINYPFLNFNGATVEVKEWISNFTPHFTRHVITYPCWDQS